jgi:hypothetical protein
MIKFSDKQLVEIGVGPNAVNLRGRVCFYYPLWLLA